MKKRATPAGRCSPIVAFRATERGKTARSGLRNFLWHEISTEKISLSIFDYN